MQIENELSPYKGTSRPKHVQYIPTALYSNNDDPWLTFDLFNTRSFASSYVCMGKMLKIIF